MIYYILANDGRRGPKTIFGPGLGSKNWDSSSHSWVQRHGPSQELRNLRQQVREDGSSAGIYWDDIDDVPEDSGIRPTTTWGNHAEMIWNHEDITSNMINVCILIYIERYIYIYKMCMYINLQYGLTIDFSPFLIPPFCDPWKLTMPNQEPESHGKVGRKELPPWPIQWIHCWPGLKLVDSWGKRLRRLRRVQLQSAKLEIQQVTCIVLFSHSWENATLSDL